MHHWNDFSFLLPDFSFPLTYSLLIYEATLHQPTHFLTKLRDQKPNCYPKTELKLQSANCRSISQYYSSKKLMKERKK